MSIVDKGKGPTVEAGLCRCCGGVKRCRLLNAEYTWQGQKEVYCDIFETCFGIVLSNLEGEATEKLICAACVSKLRDASQFRQQVLRCEKEFSSIHQNERNNKKQEQQRNSVKPDLQLWDIEAESEDHSDYNGDLEFMQTESSLSLTNQDQSISIQVESTVQSQKQTQEHEARSNGSLTKDKYTISNIKKSYVHNEEIEVEETPAKTRTWSRIQSILKKIMKSKAITAQNSQGSKPGVTNQTNKKTLHSPSFLNAIILVENSYACPFNALRNNFSCVYCKEKFFSAEGLREHTMTHNPQEYQHILHHLRNSNKCLIDLQRIDCRLCDQKITDYNTFQQHITEVHGKTFHPSTTDDTFVILKFCLTNLNLNCMECGKVFTYFFDLRHHMTQHFGRSVCEVCGMHFFTDSIMRNHLKNHNPVKDNFTCPICGKSFKYMTCIRIHISRVHNNEAMYTCYDCDESFRSLTLRRRHLAQVHNKGVVIKCKLCDKEFDSKNKWVGHNRRAHLRDFRHQCMVCDKKCFTKQDLKEHMTSHTGERKFHCEHCGKNYPRMKALKAHIQSHMKK